MGNSGLAYRPEVDGLRAVAVTSVVVYHAAGKLLPGGFLGVDIFFVISGFLITTILLRGLRDNTFSLAGFYERRARRILPALAVMMAAITVLAWFFLMPMDFRDFGDSATATATFWANVYFYRKFDYFDTESITKPLLHAWSLAIEEQFYIIFPVLLFVLYRQWRKALPWAVALLCLASFCMNAGCSSEKAAFYLLQYRAWEPLLGALAALWPQRWIPKGRTAVFLSLAGLAAVFWGVGTHAAVPPMLGVAAFLPCAGAALFILAHTNGHTLSLGGRLLAHCIPVGLGKISYSLYLWHWPLLAVLRYDQGEAAKPVYAGAAVLLALVFAYLSWRFVENPVRGRIIFKERRALFASAVACIVLLAGLGLGIGKQNGFPDRLPIPARFYAQALADKSSRPWARSTAGVMKNTVSYRFGVYEINKAGPTSFMILGDSHAVMWLAAVQKFAEEYGVGGIILDSEASNALVMGESISDNPVWNRDDYRDAVFDFAKKRGITRLLIACRYTKIFGLPVLATERKSTGGQELAMRENLQKLVAACRERGISVYFLENVPEYPYPVPRTLVQSALKGIPAKSQGYPVSYYENRNAPGEAVLASLTSADFHPLEVKSRMCPDGWCAPGDEGGAYYFDNTHLTQYGALHFKEILRPVFESPGLRTERGIVTNSAATRP